MKKIFVQLALKQVFRMIPGVPENRILGTHNATNHRLLKVEKKFGLGKLHALDCLNVDEEKSQKNFFKNLILDFLGNRATVQVQPFIHAFTIFRVLY